MALNVKKVEYFNIKIDSSADAAYNLLSTLASGGVGLLAFKAVPAEDMRTQFSLFPNDISKMKESATRAGIKLDAPHTAVMITSDSDEPGECAGIFKKLSHNNINILESIGIADIKDSYGVILYLNPEDCEKAILTLKL
jgi:hypothetical protein